MLRERINLFDIVVLRENPMLDPIVEMLIKEVIRLGGPVCITCEKNQCRYDTGLCSLCDMKAGSTGTRISL